MLKFRDGIRILILILSEIEQVDSLVIPLKLLEPLRGECPNMEFFLVRIFLYREISVLGHFSRSEIHRYPEDFRIRFT